TRFQIHLEDDPRSLQALNEAGVLDANLAPLARPPRRVVARSCCRAAYLRGAFLAAGSVTGPRNAHLELRTAEPDAARFLAETAAAEGFALGVYERDGHAVAYSKNVGTIADLLAFLGANEAALELGEGAVVAATRARANRLANADHANIVRTSRAADAQLRAIRRLEREGRLDELAPELREVARLRARHPTLSLRELARRLDPPATKAAVHRRLTRLQRLAEP
ncbi:MAG TPA: DNA-binding protein WhiA, partial [Gaiellaceae bacterium]|nr:DNA-binding protein WhiA [Gaiellaceae bacterium]